MSYACFVYDAPSDASLGFTRLVHGKHVPDRVWKAMVNVQRMNVKRDTHCELNVSNLLPHFGSRYYADKAVQAAYEVGRTHGKKTNVEDVLFKEGLLGVFHIV